jgi:predicted DNA-binding helix-hairpin-helix protein
LTDYQVYPFESKLDEPNDDLLIGEKVRVYALEWLTKEYGFDHPQLLTILEEKIFHCHFTFQESLKTKGQSDHFRSSPIQSACLEILLDWAHQGSRQAKKVIRRILRHHPYLDFRQFTLEKINLKKQLAPFVP